LFQAPAARAGETRDGYCQPLEMAEVVRPGRDVTILCYSRMRYVVMQAVQQLEKQGFDPEARTRPPRAQCFSSFPVLPACLVCWVAERNLTCRLSSGLLCALAACCRRPEAGCAHSPCGAVLAHARDSAACLLVCRGAPCLACCASRRCLRALAPSAGGAPGTQSAR